MPTAADVPMIWGEWALGNTSALIDTLRENAPDSRFIFGFNEPDHSGSYLKPEVAAERWPGMETVADALNLTLVSPCVSNFASGKWWLNTFIKAFADKMQRKPRMDMMCVHVYTPDSANLNRTINEGYCFFLFKSRLPPYYNHGIALRGRHPNYFSCLMRSPVSRCTIDNLFEVC